MKNSNTLRYIMLWALITFSSPTLLLAQSAYTDISPGSGIGSGDLIGSDAATKATKPRDVLTGPKMAQMERDGATEAQMQCAYKIYELALDQLINKANRCACQREQYNDCSDPKKLGEHNLRWEVVLNCRNELADAIFAAADAKIKAECLAH